MSRPVRVLELRSVWGTGGGPEKTILAGARRTTPDIAVTVCYIRDTRDPVFSIDERAQLAGVDYLEVRERHSLDPRIWSQLRALIRSRGIDIVHAHEYKTDVLAYFLAKAERVVPLATAHGWTGHSWREHRVYYPADKRTLARYPKVIAVSGDVRNELLAFGASASRVEVILNGIDPNAFRRDPSRRAAERARYHLLEGDLAIGAVGRLEPQKRFDNLISAVASLRATRSMLRLLIAGDGSLRAELQRQIDGAGLGNSCQLIGHCDDIRGFHDALDLLVQASDYEGTPNAVLEAMALETPVVATDAGGTAELVTDGVHGLIVRRGNLELLRDGIARALADPAATRTRAAAARARVETDLSFERRMQRVEAIYRELAAGRGSRRAAIA